MNPKSNKSFVKKIDGVRYFESIQHCESEVLKSIVHETGLFENWKLWRPIRIAVVKTDHERIFWARSAKLHDNS